MTYNLCSKLGSKMIFWRNYDSFIFAIKVPDHFPILMPIQPFLNRSSRRRNYSIPKGPDVKDHTPTPWHIYHTKLELPWRWRARGVVLTWCKFALGAFSRYGSTSIYYYRYYSTDSWQMQFSWRPLVCHALADFDTGENSTSEYRCLYGSYIQIISFAEVPETKVWKVPPT